MAYMINYTDNTVNKCDVLERIEEEDYIYFECEVWDAENELNIEVQCTNVYESYEEAMNVLEFHIANEMASYGYANGYACACGYWN